MTQKRGLCRSWLSGCGFEAVLGRRALQRSSDSWPVCSSPFPNPLGFSPAPGWDAARAGSWEISPQAERSCSPQIYVCVSFHCLALPGSGPVYQSCNPNPAPFSQLSTALIRKKINHSLQTLCIQKEKRKFDKRAETSRKLTFILEYFIARIHYIKDIDVITKITFTLCIILS